MPGKMARSAPRPPFGLPDALVAVHTSRLSCRKAGKARIFTPVRESSGESQFKNEEEKSKGQARVPRAVSRKVGRGDSMSVMYELGLTSVGIRQ